MAKQVRTFSNDEVLVAERRKKIITSAIEVFVRQGYEETTMADVATACGMSKGLLYHYVSSKEDILYLIAHDQAEGTVRGFSNIKGKCDDLSPREALLAYVDFYYGVVDRSQNYQVFLNQVAARLPRQDRKTLFDADRFALDILTSIISRGVDSADLKVKDPMLTAHNILLMGRVWADRRWFLGKHYTFQQYLELQKDAILKLVSAGGRA